MTNTLRPLTVGELLDRTFFLYRRHFLLFVGIAALPNLIILSFQLFQLVMAPRSLGGAVMTLAWLIVTMIVYFVTIAISQGATIIAVSQIQLQREATASGAFAAIRPRIGEIALVILGMGLRILVGFLFFIVPGVYLAIVWSLTIPVVVLEGAPATRRAGPQRRAHERPPRACVHHLLSAPRPRLRRHDPGPAPTHGCHRRLVGRDFYRRAAANC